jgi:hypothetical protein
MRIKILLAVMLSMLPCLRGMAVPIIGDYDAELRTADGRFDIEGNLAALRRMGANTYFYLVWHNPNDWDDLPAFADAAARDGIKVWVYLIPWSEVKRPFPAPKPFGTDYVRWAGEIGRLSQQHGNIVGYVIDDFAQNNEEKRFTPKYVREMVSAARAFNPKIKFYPLLYLQSDWGSLLDHYGDVIDGVVGCYPHGAAEIEDAIAHCEGRITGPSFVIEVPRDKKKGHSFVSRTVTARKAQAATLSFYYGAGDRFSNRRGTRTAYVKIDRKIAWSADVNGDVRSEAVTVDLSRYVKSGNSVKLLFGVSGDKEGESRPALVRFSNLHLEGFDTALDARSKLEEWEVDEEEGYRGFMHAAPRHQPEALPLILMPAGEPGQHKLRYFEEGTPEAVAANVALCMKFLEQRAVDGVVMYCLPKDANNPVLESVADEFTRRAPRRQPR